ncbi:hypothetical protein SB394_16725 [Burkholderia sp. BCCIQ04A]|uniref:Uncharacterized protein n=1 Tax=Burkholderia anthinoferrum TaxID=3090833 RepID=A0ABU5WLW3_9BURK|nr:MULTISPECIES: hypothetical protein [Burkholderia]MEB2503659.1 hypothetical protein [Burkholderia anthinoferrum]MEB2535091.1 hypothetical protein [Burkholderia anthinoferrum]MEB2560871.1 hypothetical protein [Burkholderia anthinoferrum]MEB2579417.1 hypothetical protein [Burkholderia anthinoferrum]MDF3098908.1 hypothetical protein [Burkholderia semiarida]
MAASSLKSRIERLEQQRGVTEPLIVVLRHFGEFEEGHGVFVEGVFYPCPPGESVDEIEKNAIREINPDGTRKLIVVKRAEPWPWEGE